MNPLDVAYASPGSEVLIPCVELACTSWAASRFICAGFESQVCGTEDGRLVTFEAGGLDVSLPNKDNTGSQSVTFAIDGVTGEAQNLIRQAMDEDAVIRLTLRLYLSTNLSLPAQRPYYLVVRGGSLEGATVQVQAGYFSLIDMNFNRDTYNAKTAPCIKYLGS
jgi:hypothetical protein